MKIFDNTRDSQQIAAGTHFYCKAHLCAVPVTEKSPDPRYCQSCYDFLLKEWEVIKEQNTHVKRSTWLPTTGVSTVTPGDKPLPSGCNRVTGEEFTIGENVTPNNTDKIADLINQGLSTRAIAKQAGVSHMTVSRKRKELAGIK